MKHGLEEMRVAIALLLFWYNVKHITIMYETHSLIMFC